MGQLTHSAPSINFKLEMSNIFSLGLIFIRLAMLLKEEVIQGYNLL